MHGKRLLLVAATTGYQTKRFAEAAAGLGVEVTLATDRCHVLEDPWGDAAIPVRFENPEESAASLPGGSFEAIVAVGDRPAYLAALAAEKLGIPFHPSQAVRNATNKFAARQCFRDAGMPVPEYRLIAVDADPRASAAGAKYPCVLKPLGLSASRGVIRANDPAEFEEAFLRIAKLLATPEIARLRDSSSDHIQVEDFIPGREFAFEGLVTNGRLHVLALFDKPDPLDGPYFEETIYVTPSRQPLSVQNGIIEAAQQAVVALGLRHGPIHAEMRVDGGRVWMLEIAPRPIGGLCAKALVFDGGVALEQIIVRHALGGDVSQVKLRDGASGVMMIPVPHTGIYQGVSGESNAALHADEVMITATQGQPVYPLPEGNTYLGFLFAYGGSPEEVEKRLRSSFGELAFDIATTLQMIK